MKNPTVINREGLDATSLEKINDYSLTLRHKGNTYKIPVFGPFEVVDFIDLLDLDMSFVDDEALM